MARTLLSSCWLALPDVCSQARASAMCARILASVSSSKSSLRLGTRVRGEWAGSRGRWPRGGRQGAKRNELEAAVALEEVGPEFGLVQVRPQGKATLFAKRRWGGERAREYRRNNILGQPWWQGPAEDAPF